MLSGCRSAWLAPFVLVTAAAALAFGSKLGAAVLAVVAAAAALPPGRVRPQEAMPSWHGLVVWNEKVTIIHCQWLPGLLTSLCRGLNSQACPAACVLPDRANSLQGHCNHACYVQGAAMAGRSLPQSAPTLLGHSLQPALHTVHGQWRGSQP